MTPEAFIMMFKELYPKAYENMEIEFERRLKKIEREDKKRTKSSK